MAQLSLTELFPFASLNQKALHQSLGDDFSLCENDNMVFHWADFHQTCDLVKSRIESDPAMRTDYKIKEEGLKRQALIPVWIRTDKKVHQTTMFDLYERYILNQMKLSLGIDPFGSIEISFISGTGPFKEMAISECFNRITYKDFIMVYLLKGKMPRREYRIRLKSKILMEYGAEFSKSHLINLEQLTSHGLLMSLDYDFYLKNIASASEVRLLIDSKCLTQSLDKPLPELKAHMAQYAFNLLYSSSREDSISCEIKQFDAQSSFDFLKNKKVYLFVSYDKLSGSHEKIRDIKQFVTHTKNLILDHYSHEISKKTA